MSSDRALRLTSLPVEILTQILGSPDSFTDVLALANSCRQLRAVFEDNLPEISEHVIPRCIGTPDEARTLMLIQEVQTQNGVSQARSMTPHMFLRMARNALKVTKAKAFFNKEVMPRIRPADTQRNMEVWGTPKRPPLMTETEELRFERGYYLAAALMEPDGLHILDTIALRHLYYVYDMGHLNRPIGDEIVSTGQRNKLEKDVWKRMVHLWEKYLGPRHLRGKNTLAAGAESFGCYCSHVTLFDHYQSQLRHELLPEQYYTAHVSLTQEELDNIIWGKGNYDDSDT